MKRILVSLSVSILFCLTSQGQTIETSFKTVLKGRTISLTSDQKLDCEYCLRGTIYFYNNSTGEKVTWTDFNSYDLEGYSVPSKVLKQGGESLSFKLFFVSCSDSKKRLVDSKGIQVFDKSGLDMDVYESGDSAISIPFDDASKAQLKQQKEVHKKEEQRKADAEQELVANEKRTIKVGDLLYICNGGGPCEVIAREVTPTKIKVEFISKCYPENRGGSISRWTHITQGHQRWLEKKYIYGTQKVNCYGKQSAIR